MLLSHDDAVARAREAARAFTPERAASLFVASLDRDRARLPGRAALACFVVARHLPEHPFRRTTLFSMPYLCGGCGYGLAASDTWPIDLRDLDDLLAQGYAHLFPQPGPVALVLERLAPSAAEPSATSVNTLRALLDAIATPPPGPGPGRSRAFDAMARAFRSNKYQRQWIFETLAVCGALPVRNRPSYWERYVPQDERPDPPERNNELKYPASFWTASDGVDAGRVNEVFGHLFERAWVAPG